MLFRTLTVRGLGVVAALAMAVSPAKAVELPSELATAREWVEFFKFVLDLHDLYSEYAEGLDRTNPPEFEQAWTELDERATSYHVPEGLKAPPLPASQALSSDKTTRDEARKAWSDFVQADRAEIERFRQRREAHKAALTKYRDKYEALTDAEKRLFRESGDPTVSAFAGDELAWKWFEIFNSTLPKAYDVMKQYERIVKEFDRAITLREAQHVGHVATLETLEVITGASAATPDGARLDEPPASSKPNGTPGGSIGEKVSTAVTAEGEGTLNSAKQTRTDIERMAQERRKAEAIDQQSRMNRSGSAGGPGGGGGGDGAGVGQSSGGGGSQCEVRANDGRCIDLSIRGGR